MPNEQVMGVGQAPVNPVTPNRVGTTTQSAFPGQKKRKFAQAQALQKAMK